MLPGLYQTPVIILTFIAKWATVSTSSGGVVIVSLAGSISPSSSGEGLAAPVQYVFNQLIVTLSSEARCPPLCPAVT